MHYKKYIIPALLMLFSCSNPETGGGEEPDDKAQQIIDKAIEKAGGDRFENAVIDFDFREHHYRSRRKGGSYSYERIREDSAGTTRDILDNYGFKRYLNDEESTVADTMAVKYSSSINSVIYFALLPYGLNDPAVNKEYLGEAVIDGESYHKIRVSFEEEGGGEDFRDIFIYWIDKETYEVDYLAYEYLTEGGGKRFRKAVNPRVVEGIRFVDYINYKPVSADIPIEKSDSVFNNDGMTRLSEIILNDVEVKY